MKKILVFFLLLAIILPMFGCNKTYELSEEELMAKVDAITPYMSEELMSQLPLTDKIYRHGRASGLQCQSGNHPAAEVAGAEYQC